VPRQLLADCNLVGSESEVRERLAAYRDAGVTHLSVIPIGPDPVKLVEQLRTLVD
jgi:alkanesulfonate monooxygenase SsuD/methylene tetrahydromethanopterin reductase-like flavin-dependent oxidoreductase (luciferase family)